MFRYAVILFSLLWLQLLAACSADNLTRGLYDGVRVRNDLQSAPSERFGKPQEPDYPEYERLRKEQR